MSTKADGRPWWWLVARKRMVLTGLALLVASAVGVGTFARVAEARVRVVVPVPIFVPAPQFNFDGGYYRTNDGRYYHYDRDRDGWHYGRNHGEGRRYEERQQRHGHH